MPFRWNVVIVAFLVWNALFLLDGFVSLQGPKLPGLFVQLALLLVFVSCLAILRSPAAQAFVLRPGRSIQEVRPLLVLLQVVSGFMFVMFTLLRYTGAQR